MEVIRMEETYKIVHVEQPGEAEWGTIGPGISAYNEQHAGDEASQWICYVIHDPDAAIVGGVIAVVYWDWLYVDLMWLKEALRGQGYGSRLLTMAEEAARERGAKHAYLDTFSFQAPGFYEKRGYEVFGELKDFPQGHQRYFMTKEL
jgi:GNAT superfamily N-acetyltransferase